MNSVHVRKLDVPEVDLVLNFRPPSITISMRVKFFKLFDRTRIQEHLKQLRKCFSMKLSTAISSKITNRRYHSLCKAIILSDKVPKYTEVHIQFKPLSGTKLSIWCNDKVEFNNIL